ncbi:hypothetical protein CBL_20948 [Carabus blaptoides fortunei]
MLNSQNQSSKSMLIVKQKIDKDFEKSLKRLCPNLLSYLKEVQESARIAEERLKQVQAILTPWPAPPRVEVDCLCKKNLETMTVAESNADLALMDNISRTLDSAKTLRLKEAKSRSKLIKSSGKSSSSAMCGKSSVSEISSLTTNDKQTSVKSSLVVGKPTSACSKSTSPYLSKTSIGANTKSSNTRATKSARTDRIPSDTSKTSATTTNVFGHSDSTKIRLQPNNVSLKTSVSSTSAGTIPKTTSSTIRKSSFQLGTCSQSTVHSTSSVSFVFTNTSSSTVLQMSSKDLLNVKSRPVQLTLQNNRGSLWKHSSASSLHTSTQPVPSSVSCTSLATGNTSTEHTFTRRIPIQSSEKSSRLTLSNKSISTATISAANKENDLFKYKTKLHCPSCPCYKTKDEQPKSSTLSLAEALAVYRIPSTLRKSAKYYLRFVQQAEKEESSKSDSKIEFLQALHTRNEDTIDTYMENIAWTNEFVKYISMYATYENKIQPTKCEDQMQYVPYTNTKDLAEYLNSKCQVRNKELWNQILRSIIEDVIPTVKAEGNENRRSVHQDGEFHKMRV